VGVSLLLFLLEAGEADDTVADAVADADASIAAAAVEKDRTGLLDSHMFLQSLL
jgi:hypothetical protein